MLYRKRDSGNFRCKPPDSLCIIKESIEFQKRVLMTGLINSRSKKSGMLVERKSRNRHPNFLFENDV